MKARLHPPWWHPLWLLLCPWRSSSSSLFFARLCRDFACNQLGQPIPDYDEVAKQCVCREHPCWDDNGEMHLCEQRSFPYLSFDYSDEGALQCRCSSVPHYGSIYVAKHKCPGHRCEDPTHPILDWDDMQGCVCRSHPCWSEGDKKHTCDKPGFPILRYREETDTNGNVKPLCDCFAKLVKLGTEDARFKNSVTEHEEEADFLPDDEPSVDDGFLPDEL